MISFKILFEIMKRTIQLQSPHIIIQMLNNLAILDTHDTTNAFPIQKYRIFSGIPVFVQLSANPLSLSHSIGVSALSLPVCKSVTT